MSPGDHSPTVALCTLTLVAFIHFHWAMAPGLQPAASAMRPPIPISATHLREEQQSKRRQKQRRQQQQQQTRFAPRPVEGLPEDVSAPPKGGEVVALQTLLLNASLNDT
eukprot:COSAG02_NODE_22988_length_733_cov_1.048896_1_plen_108_part_10